MDVLKSTFTFFIVFISLILFGQKKELDPCRQLIKGVALYEAKKYEDADEVLSVAAMSFERMGYWSDWYESILWRYKVANKTDYKKLVHYLDDIMSESIISDEHFKAKAYYLASAVFGKLGRVYDSVQLREECLNIYQNLKNDFEVRRMLYNLSEAYAKFNDHETAIKCSELLLEKSDQLSDKRHLRALKNLCKYYHFNQEYEVSQKKIIEFEESFPANRFELLDYKVGNLIQLDRLDEAEKYLDNVHPLLLNSPSILVKYNKAETKLFEAQGEYQKAYANRLKIYNTQSDNDDSRELIKEKQNLAELLFHLGKYAEALEMSHEVTTFFCNNFKSQTLNTIPDSSQIVAEAWLKKALHLKAKISIKYYEASGDTMFISNSLHLFDRAIYTIDLLRNQYLTISSKYKMSEASRSVFSDAIDFCLSLFEQKGDQQYFDKAFRYSQLSKSYTIKESIGEREKHRLLNIPDSLSSRYFKLINERYSGGSNYLDVERKVEKLENLIRTKYPLIDKYRSRKPVSLDKLQGNLGDSQRILDYYVDEKKVYCFVIDKKQYIYYVKELPENIEDIVNTYHKSLTDMNFISDSTMLAESMFLNSSELISNIILPHQLTNENINHLIICADGFVKKVAFKTLPIESLHSWKEHDKMLISRFATSYVYDFSQLNNLTEAVVNNKICIGVDFEKLEKTDELNFSVLPNVKREIEQISERIGGEKYLNTDVTKNVLLGALQNYDMLHYSGHSIMDKDDYTESYIPVYGKEENIDILSYKEIISLTTPLELLVLNACNTHNGLNVATEGTFSLSRAFSIGGARSILGTNWNAPDKSSTEIISQFYKNLSDGEDRAVALQKAQIEYLSNDQISSPALRIPSFWAHLSLYGNTSKISMKKFLISTPVFFSIMIFFVLILVVKYK